MGRIPPRRPAPRLSPAPLGAHVVLLGLSALILAPYLWAVGASLTPLAAAAPPRLAPHTWTLDNYSAVLTNPDSGLFLLAYLHSAIVALSVTLASLVTSTLVGFVLTAYRFRGKETLFVALIATFMIPFVCVMIPLYVNVVHLGLADSLAALVVTGLWSPLGILIMRQFMEGVPREMLEAARLDGAGEWRLVLHLFLPLCTSALGILALYSFMHTWDDFQWPAIVLHDPALWTLPLLGNYLSANGYPVATVMTVAVLTILPVIALYAVVARFFIRGLGAVVVQI